MAGLTAKIFLVSSCIVFAMAEYAVAETCTSSSCMVAKETVLLQFGAQKINGKGHRRPHGGLGPVPAIKPPAPMALPEQEEKEEKVVCCEGHNKNLRKVRKGRCLSTATKNRQEVPMKRCDEAMYVEIANGASTCPTDYKAIQDTAGFDVDQSLPGYIDGYDQDADVLACKQAGAKFGYTWDRIMYPGADFPVGCFGHSDGKVRLNTNTGGRPTAPDISDYSVICIQVSGAPPPPGSPPIAHAGQICADFEEEELEGDFPDAATCVKKASTLCKGDFVWSNGEGKCDCCEGTGFYYSLENPKGNVYKIKRR